jgi:hypothetical protein
MATDESLSPRQIKQLLRHICSQHLDFMTYAHPILPVSERNDNDNVAERAWRYFKSLPLLERFNRISESLNEDNFRMTLLLMLNSIKLSTYRATNGTFLCLKSHLDAMFNSSLRCLMESKNSKSKTSDVLKLFEFDENLSWNPAKSEWILNHLNLRSSFAAKYMTGQAKIDFKDFCVIGSSILIRNVETLQAEVETVLVDQYRYMVRYISFFLRFLARKISSLN